MLDRESTFAEPEIVQLLKTEFVPVAIDQAYQRRQKDTEGEFYRKIAGQGPRNDFQGTTQGFYIATASGKLLLYNNNRDPQKVRRLMKQKLQAFNDSGAADAPVKVIQRAKVDRRYKVKPPRGGLVIRVRAKVLGGYKPTTNRWRRIFQTALSRDNLWMSASEHQALVNGTVPRSLQMRMARFHLVDNTRGEPTMWRPEDVRHLEMSLSDGRFTGKVQLKSERRESGYEPDLFGKVEVKDRQVVRFDVVAKGDYWGSGRFTRGAPEGKFPLAVSFTLADGSDVADEIPPQASRGWLKGYLP